MSRRHRGLVPRAAASTLTTAALTRAATAAKSTPVAAPTASDAAGAPVLDAEAGVADVGGRTGIGAVGPGGRVPAATSPTRKLTAAVNPIVAPASLVVTAVFSL
jgi:hypothetical protein